MQISVGIKVAARGLEWDVMEVETLGAVQRIRARCASGDLAGLEWDLLHPAEPVKILRTDPGPEDIGTLAEWRRFHIACLLDQIPGAPAPPGRVAIEAYQRVPLLRALDMVRPRLLLADGVGLGKTIQAGLIAAELIVRRRAHRVLIVCPPGPLLRQWEQEMRLRFGLRFTVIADAAGLRAARRGLELGGNPFTTTALCLTSMDFGKSDRVLAELERASWDLVIIDEAHHCVGAPGPLGTIGSGTGMRSDLGAGTGSDTDAVAGNSSAASRGAGDDSQRRVLAEVLARRGDGLLLLTATPHDGYDPHFASLIALLDPSLVDGTGKLIGTLYRRHVVRRLKSHIRDPHTGLPLFKERVVIPVPIDAGHAPEVRAFHRALSDLVAPRLRRSRDKDGLADALAFVSLLKRSMSTIAACAATLRVVAERYAIGDTAASRKMRRRALRAYRSHVEKFGVLDPAGEEDIAALEAEEIAASLASGRGSPDTSLQRDPAAGGTSAAKTPVRDVINRDTAPAGPAGSGEMGSETMANALADLIGLSEAAAAQDPKLAALVTEIRLIRLARPGANILIYTEYADSQRAAVTALHGLGTVLTISGADTEADRTRAAERCAREDGIILVSTDSLAEGLNLHQRCCHLIHLDLPYNPNRLEQRNGRIDRYGQRQDPEIRYLYLVGTFEERLLLRLIAKYEKARSCLSFMPNTLGLSAAPGVLSEPLFPAFGAPVFPGFGEDLFSALPRLVHSLDLTAEDSDSEAFRNLLREIDRAFQSFDHMAVRHGWMGGQTLNLSHGTAPGDGPGERADAARPGETPDEMPNDAHRDETENRIDLAAFVVSALAAATGAPADGPAGFSAAGISARGGHTARVPAEWMADIAGLPGVDVNAGTVRLTPDRAAGASDSLYPGRVHPLTRRAVALAQTIRTGRISAARAADFSLLATFTAEIAGASGTLFRKIVALRLFPETHAAAVPSRIVVEPDVLRFNEPVAPDGLWNSHFGAWAPAALNRAKIQADAVAHSLAAGIAVEYQARIDRRHATLDAWLERRAAEMCGPPVRRNLDLFEYPAPEASGQPPADWRSPAQPQQRLAALASDDAVPMARRREAAAILAQLPPQYPALPPPSVRLLGLLMLVPA